MSDRLQTILSPSADDLFRSVAVPGDGPNLGRLDVAGGQLAARHGIETAVRNALGGVPSPGARICLINGKSGTGKSHVLVTTIGRLVADPQSLVLPIVLQLTARVEKADYERWLLDAAFRQLGSRYFGLRSETPLMALATALLELAPVDAVDEFRYALGESDDERLSTAALAAAASIQVELRARLDAAPPEPGHVAALLLAAHGDTSSMTYLRTGQCDARMTALGLHPAHSAFQKVGILEATGLLLEALGGALVVALDQLESSAELGQPDIMVHSAAQGVRLVELVSCCALVLCAYTDAWEKHARERLYPSDRERIEDEAPQRVNLSSPSRELLTAVLQKRLTAALARAGETESPSSLEPLPDWLARRILVDERRSVRQAILSVNRFRVESRSQGRPASAAECGFEGDPITGPLIDFDKLWADYQDTHPNHVLRFLPHTKAELLQWWASEASREHPTGDPAAATVTTLGDAHQTQVVDVVVRSHGLDLERRSVALCEAPNAKSQLHDQIMGFLKTCTAVPAVLRTKGFPVGRTSQVAPALKLLQDIGGFRLQLSDLDWSNLQLARDFVNDQQSAPGFAEWRRERQWLIRWMRPLEPLIDVPAPAPGWQEPLESSLRADPRPAVSSAPFPLVIGPNESDETVLWDPYREAPEHLNNFSFLVTGDAGSGKTQTIRVLIDAAARSGLSICIFDFKNDYADPGFVGPLGLRVVDIRDEGLPFNPMEPPPRGPAGVHPVEHAFELASVLARVFSLGPVQAGRLREVICAAYEQVGIPVRKKVDPSTVRWPSFEDALALLDEKKDAAMRLKLVMLVELGLFPSAPRSTFAELVDQRVCLKLNDLPSDEFKAAVAELLIIQLHGYALRGEQPRKLRRLLVFDEAHRISGSQRLESLAREGRAFGIGVVIGTQFPGDIPDTMAGNLATQLFLMNGQAEHRNFVVRQVYGGLAGAEAKRLQAQLGDLKPLHGLFTNAHHRATFVRVIPHYQRSAPPAESRTA